MFLVHFHVLEQASVAAENSVYGRVQRLPVQTQVRKGHIVTKRGEKTCGALTSVVKLEIMFSQSSHI